MDHRMLSESKDGYIVQEVTGTYVSPINATEVDMLWAAAGQASPSGALLLVVLVGSWIVWPVNLLQYRRFFEVFGWRSDMIFGYLFGLVLPLWILFSGALVGRDLFQWIKLLSLTVAAVIFNAIKFHLPPPNRLWHGWRMSVIYSFLGHGILFVNVAEAVVWEMTQLQGRGFNYLNGVTGGVQMFMIVAYAKRYGFGVLERDEENERQLRANLTPLYILGYTFWNIEYMSVYHPEKAMFYIYVTLLVPIMAAFLGSIDWLEIRAQALLHAIVLRLLPIKFSAPTPATLFLFEDVFVSDAFRYTFAVLGAVTTVFMAWEIVFRINRGRAHFNFWGYADKVDVDNRHPARYYRDGDLEDDDDGKITATGI